MQVAHCFKRALGAKCCQGIKRALTSCQDLDDNFVLEGLETYIKEHFGVALVQVEYI